MSETTKKDERNELAVQCCYGAIADAVREKAKGYSSLSEIAKDMIEAIDTVNQRFPLE